MSKKQNESKTNRSVSAQPRLHQRAREIQAYGPVNHALDASNTQVSDEDASQPECESHQL